MLPEELHAGRLADSFFQARPRMTASEWICSNVRLNEPKIRGQFTLKGRENLRELIDAWGPLYGSLAGKTDFITCAATGSGKTIGTIGGLSYRIANSPMRALIVKPTAHGPAGARSYSRTRLMPAIKSTDCLRDKIPTGAERFDFTSTQMQINGSVLDLTGSNSVGQLAENRCDVVLQDEIDKYPVQTEESKEADPIYLADERTKGVSGARRYKYSTPTLANTGIWEWFKKGDQRRWFVPCPHCNPNERPKNEKEKNHDKIRESGGEEILPGTGDQNVSRSNSVRNSDAGGNSETGIKIRKGWIVLAWSKQFTVFALRGDEAFIKWDDSARGKDGEWSLDEVVKTAHFVCPHCRGQIRDSHKSWMNARGEWVATAKGAPGFVSWHLPSMYSISPDCSFGAMAKKFLMAKKSLNGVKGFINSDLAEPDISQAVSVNTAGIVGKHIEITGEWLKILSADYHAQAPYFWALIGAWNGSDAVHMVEYDSFNNWNDLDALQEKKKIIKEAVIIDAGFEQAEVARECCQLSMLHGDGSPMRCELVPAVQDGLPEIIGWQPAKSFGGQRLYRVVENDRVLWQPWKKDKFIDPFIGTEMARQMKISLLEFLENPFEDMLENIINGKTGLKWSISKECDTDEFHKHMAAKVKKPWKKNVRDMRWQTVPGRDDHLRLCAILQLVLAVRLQLISFKALQTVTSEEKTK